MLHNKISGEDHFIFTELTNASQRKIQMCCYGITSEHIYIFLFRKKNAVSIKCPVLLMYANICLKKVW